MPLDQGTADHHAGVHMPHCAPHIRGTLPARREAERRWRFFDRANVRSIGFDCGNQATIDDRAVHQHRAGAAFASPHPSFVPVNFSSSRKTSSSRAMGYAWKQLSLPLTVHSIAILLTISTTRASFLHHRFHQHLRRRGNFSQTYAGRVLNGVQDRRRGTVHRQLADALRSVRAESIRLLFEENADRGNVAAVGMM